MAEDPKRPFRAEVSDTSVSLRFEALSVALREAGEARRQNENGRVCARERRAG